MELLSAFQRLQNGHDLENTSSSILLEVPNRSKLN